MTALEARSAAVSATLDPPAEKNFRARCLEGIKTLTVQGCFSLKIHLLNGYGTRPDCTDACHKVMQYLRAQGYEVSEPVDCPNDHLNRKAIVIGW